MTKIRPAGLLALFVFSSIVGPKTSIAQSWVIKPMVGLQQEYDDNFRLSDELNGSVYTTTIPVGLEVSRSTKTLDLRGRAEYDFIEYSGDGLQDRDNLFVDVFSSYRTETARWRFNGSFQRDTILRTVELDSPSDVLSAPQDVDVQLIGFNIRRNRLYLRPSWEQNITERTGVGLRYQFLDTFQDDIRGVDLVDFRDHLFTGQIFTDVTQRDRAKVTLGTEIYRGEDARNFESYSLVAGLDHAFSETTKSGIELGIRHSAFDTPEENGNDNGFIGNLYVDRRGQNDFFSLVLERRLLPSSNGELLDARQIDLRMEKALSPRLKFLMRTRAFRTVSFRNNRDRNYFSVAPALQWSLTRWWSVAASYRYRLEDRDDLSGSVDSNAVLVSLTYEKPFENLFFLGK